MMGVLHCMQEPVRICKNDKNADPCGSMCIYICILCIHIYTYSIYIYIYVYYVYVYTYIYIYLKRCGSLNLGFNIFRSCFFQNLDSPKKNTEVRVTLVGQGLRNVGCQNGCREAVEISMVVGV